MLELDTKSKYLYENFRQVLDIYQDAIINCYETLFNGKLSDEKLTPAELADNLAMCMYEIEDKMNEQL